MAAWDDFLRLLEPDTPPAGRPPRVPPETFNSYLRMKRAAVPLGAEQTGLPGIARPPLPAGLMAQLPEDQGGERLFSKPVARPGYRPLTLPKDRPPTPEEFAAFRQQEEQGIQPELSPPMSPLDLGMEAVGSALGEADIPSYLLPAAGLLGIVRYKKPGVSAANRETAQAYHRSPTYDPVEAKNVMYHATDPRYVEKILNQGEIVPRPYILEDLGLGTWSDFKKLKPLTYESPAPKEAFELLIAKAKADPHTSRKLNETISERFYGSPEYADKPAHINLAINEWLTQHAGDDPRYGYTNPLRNGKNLSNFANWVFGNALDDVGGSRALADLGYRYKSSNEIPDPGVSISRVPRVSSKATKAISFVLDPKKMPPTRPYAEPGYRKTTDFNQFGEHQPGMPNWTFEFEDRTFNEAIPTKAIREIWVDRSALFDRGWANDPESALGRLYKLAEQHNVPVREFNTGKEMHRGPMTELAPRWGQQPRSLTEMQAEAQERRQRLEQMRQRKQQQPWQTPLPPVPMTPHPPSNLLQQGIANMAGDPGTLAELYKMLGNVPGYSPGIPTSHTFDDFLDDEFLAKEFPEFQ